MLDNLFLKNIDEKKIHYRIPKEGALFFASSPTNVSYDSFSALNVSVSQTLATELVLLAIHIQHCKDKSLFY